VLDSVRPATPLQVVRGRLSLKRFYIISLASARDSYCCTRSRNAHRRRSDGSKFVHAESKGKKKYHPPPPAADA